MRLSVRRLVTAGTVWCLHIRKERDIAVRNDLHHVDGKYEVGGGAFEKDETGRGQRAVVVSGRYNVA